MYAPLPFALHRVVPEGGNAADGHFLPAGVSGKEQPLDLKRNIKDTDGFNSDHCINQPNGRKSVLYEIRIPL